MKDLDQNIDQPTGESRDAAQPEIAIVESRRRRLVRGAAAGVGVLLAVQAKTALGTGTCQSPSARMSGNTSPRPGDGSTCSGGRSPGFWKVPQHFSYWRNVYPPTFVDGVVIKECATGLGNLSNADLASKGTTFSSKFGSQPAGVTSNPGFWSILAFPNLYGSQGQLARHLSAAYLNAQYFNTTGQKYPLTPGQVVDMWTQLTTTGGYCPPNIGSCPTRWSAADVIAYIEGLYDLNSAVENDLCK